MPGYSLVNIDGVMGEFFYINVVLKLLAKFTYSTGVMASWNHPILGWGCSFNSGHLNITFDLWNKFSVVFPEVTLYNDFKSRSVKVIMYFICIMLLGE